jgi:Bacterial PH domain
MAPSFIGWFFVSLFIVASALYLWRANEFDPYGVRYTTYALLGPIWIVQLGIWVFRILTLNYRLTTHRFVVERNFFPSPFLVIELTRIARVGVEQRILESWVGVGRIRLHLDNQDAPLLLPGIKDPERIAVKIRNAIANVKAESGS